MFLNLEEFDDVEYASTVKCDDEDWTMKMKLILIIHVGIVTIHQMFQMNKLMENKL